MQLFGLNIEKAKKPHEEDKSASFAVPIDDEGSSIIAAATNAAYYGVYVDINGLIKDDIQLITKCREIALYPEIDIALQDIVNEAIPQEDDSALITLDLEALEISDTLKDRIQSEFKKVLTLLRYNELASDIFRRWYIDGRLYYHIIVDKSNLKRGIVELRLIEATKIKKYKEVKKKATTTGANVIDDINEFFIYNESGFIPQTNTGTTGTVNTNQLTGLKLSPDSVIYVPSGYVDNNNNNVLSYLQKAIRPANQLRMLEDATVVYFIARAPERRIFYVDVGNLPKQKAEQYVKEMMNKYRNKMVYDAKSGEVRDDKKYMSMLEDFWMPRRDSSTGTEIKTLPGAQGLQGQIDSLDYFRKKMYEALNVPVSRLQEQSGFSLGNSGEITRDELKFQKFIERCRRKFAQLFLDTLKVQLQLKGICNEDEWDTLFKENIRLRYQRDNYFSELKNLNMVTQRISVLPQVDQYLQKYYSKKYIQSTILGMSEDEIGQMNDQMQKEAGDPTAQPTILGGGMPPGAMGEQPGQDDQNPDQGADQSQNQPQQ